MHKNGLPAVKEGVSLWWADVWRSRGEPLIKVDETLYRGSGIFPSTATRPSENLAAFSIVYLNNRNLPEASYLCQGCLSKVFSDILRILCVQDTIRILLYHVSQ